MRIAKSPKGTYISNPRRAKRSLGNGVSQEGSFAPCREAKRNGMALQSPSVIDSAIDITAQELASTTHAEFSD